MGYDSAKTKKKVTSWQQPGIPQPGIAWPHNDTSATICSEFPILSAHWPLTSYRCDFCKSHKNEAS